MPDVWTIGQVTQSFGPTTEQLDGSYTYNGKKYDHFNKGIDIGAPAGTLVTANIDGVVTNVLSDPNNSTGWGLSVWVRDKSGNIHRYSHLQGIRPNLVPGTDIKKGNILGTVGSTGKSTGPHLSYDVDKGDGQFVNPNFFVSDKPKIVEGLGQAGTWKLDANGNVIGLQGSGGSQTPPTGSGTASSNYSLSLGGNKPRVGIAGPIAKPQSPVAHLLPPNIASADFETQIDYLMDSYFDLLDQVTAGGLDTLTDDEIFALGDAEKRVLGRFNAVGKALNTLMSMKNQGLVTTNVDAAKAFVETEEGKQQNASKAFDDYTKRVSTLTNLGTFQHNMFQAATKNYLDAADANSQLPQQIINGERSPLTSPILMNMQQSDYGVGQIKNNVANSIPNRIPDFYNVPNSAYDNFYNEVNSRAGRRGLSSYASNLSTMPANQLPYEPGQDDWRGALSVTGGI